MSNSSTERKKYIDIARGIGMILVILGHYHYTNEQLKVWLYSFHMPLFFIISGIVFSTSKTNFFAFIKHKTKKLLVPYFVLSLILWGLVVTIIRGFSGVKIEELIGILVSYRRTNFYFSMWFILALFLSEILVFPLLKGIEKLSEKLSNKTANCVLTIVALISILLGNIVNGYVKGYIWSIDLVPLGVGFILLGVLIRNNIDFFKDRIFKIYLLPIFLVINIACAYWNYKLHGMTDLYGGNTGNYFLFLSGAVSGSLFIIARKLLYETQQSIRVHWKK